MLGLVNPYQLSTSRGKLVLQSTTRHFNGFSGCHVRIAKDTKLAYERRISR